ncbi:hypothetical protein ACPCHT_32180 [Nucisporomicrobium flavum]|uniref:8-oxoguanine DNA glycosylase OGG fold protein n=1 Tax=Nucisporomicrobium flavum TaxID=2785915 RepID=UPI003C2D77AE
MSVAAPAGLSDLVRRYKDETQPAVTYIVGSWERALAGSADAGFLEDPRWTRPSSVPGRRNVDRRDLERLMTAVQMDDEPAVRQAFVLIMAWGSGTSNTRSYRYTRTALASPQCTQQLVHAATTCRDGNLAGAYTGFSLPGVRRSFFTKWFAFAGRAAGRSWQPLILDDRVLRTLNVTSGLSTTALAGSRSWGRRYAAYVHHMHSWSQALREAGVHCSPERLEWLFFAHNGGRAGSPRRSVIKLSRPGA